MSQEIPVVLERISTQALRSLADLERAENPHERQALASATVQLLEFILKATPVLAPGVLAPVAAPPTSPAPTVATPPTETNGAASNSGFANVMQRLRDRAKK